MVFVNVGSGSKGNTSIFIEDDYVLLIDAGISKRRVNNALKVFNKTFKDINAILITHDHIDHISQIKNYDDNIIYSTSFSYKCLKENYLKFNKEKEFGPFKVFPILLSHDGNTTGYIISTKNETFGYVTDTGFIPEKSLTYLNNLNYYYFESNYDIDLLISSRRSDELKSRIMSYKGHLGNEESAIYLSRLIGKNTKKIMLAHLSEECNDPLIALKTHQLIYKENEVDFNIKDVICAKQKEEVKLC